MAFCRGCGNYRKDLFAVTEFVSCQSGLYCLVKCVGFSTNDFYDKKLHYYNTISMKNIVSFSHFYTLYYKK